ncbi:hypothetical protein M758_2G149100 [Ceratodon purpureus]|nr:hypothetical protein M758_2G149100 [Ceratodon purpureus]
MRSERLRSQYPFAKPRKLPEHPFHAVTTPASNSHLHHITAMPNFANHPPTSLPNPIQSRPRISETPNPIPQIPKPPGPQRLPHLQLQQSAPFSNPKDETHAQPPNSLSLSHSLTPILDEHETHILVNSPLRIMKSLSKPSSPLPT